MSGSWPNSSSFFTAVEIEINPACNRRCSYCPNSLTPRPKSGEIDPKLFEKLLGELRELDFRGRVSYDFYNEPLLHSDFEGIVAQTRSFLPAAAIEVYTNGTRLTRERLQKLLELGVSRFIVTRHENDAHDAFQAALAGLDAESRQKVLYRSYQELTLTNRGGLLPHLGAEGQPLTPCFIPSFLVTVTVGGHVLPCFEDFHERLVMGNLAEQKLIDIWNSEKYALFRAQLRTGQRHLFAPCRGCNRREVLPPPMGSRECTS